MGSFAFIALSLSPLGANMLFAFVLLLGLVAFILLDKKHA
jgi:hypothetical protein